MNLFLALMKFKKMKMKYFQTPISEINTLQRMKKKSKRLRSLEINYLHGFLSDE